MGSRLGKRIIYYANLPIKLLMPTSFENIGEIGIKTIPSASKDHECGRKEEAQRRNTTSALAKPDYKKAYVTLKHPLSLNPNLFPISLVEEDRKSKEPKQSKEVISEKDGRRQSHWLDETREENARANYRPGKQGARRQILLERRVDGRGGARESRDDDKTKFPWSSMRNKK